MSNTNSLPHLPHNLEAERAVIGDILSGRDATNILDIVSTEDFYDTRHQLVFDAITELYHQGVKPDFITVSDKIASKGLDERVPSSYLTECMNTVYNASGEATGRIVKRDAGLRRTVISAHKILAYAQAPEESKETLESLVTNLEVDAAGVTRQKKRPAIEHVIDRMQKEVNQYASGERKIFPTGFENVDNILTGFMLPHVWVIGADTGTGKSFFGLTLVAKLIRAGMKPVIFSTENSDNINALRIIGAMTGIPEIKLKVGNLNEAEKIRYEKAKLELGEMPLFIYDQVFSVEEIRLKAKKHKIQDGSNLIVIDYVQQLNKENKEAVYDRMSTVASKLQRLAIELDMGIMAMSQLPTVKPQQGRRAADEVLNFKGAGEIKEIADVAIWIKKHPKEKHKLLAVMDKVRHGIPGKVIFDFFSPEVMAEGAYLRESADQDDKPDIKKASEAAAAMDFQGDQPYQANGVLELSVDGERWLEDDGTYETPMANPPATATGAKSEDVSKFL